MAIQPTTSDTPIAGPSRTPYVPVQTLNAHGRSVTALTYSGDGRTLVSGGADGWVHLWCAQFPPHWGLAGWDADGIGMERRASIYGASKLILKVYRYVCSDEARQS